MKKISFKNLLLIGLIASGPMLFSCAGGEDGPAKGSPVYTVNYFDEDGTQVGYAYVPENRAASFRSMDGENYDWLPHTDMDLTTPGARFVFDKWVGTYDASFSNKVDAALDDQEVDLEHIKGDCKVVASFKEKAYKMSAVFKNCGKTYEEKTVDFGAALAYPATNPSEEHPEYYNAYNFEGWTLDKDTSNTKVAFTSANALTNTWKDGTSGPAWGLGAPDDAKATGNCGVIYLDKTLTNHMPTYPAYLSDGAKWIEVGNLLGDKLKLEFTSKYETEYKEFQVTLTSTGGNPVSFNVKYGDEITYERVVSTNSTTLEVKYNGVSKYTYSVANTSGGVANVTYLLEGTYTNATAGITNPHSELIEGRKLGFSLEKDSNNVPTGGKVTIQGNCEIKPIIHQVNA